MQKVRFVNGNLVICYGHFEIHKVIDIVRNIELPFYSVIVDNDPSNNIAFGSLEHRETDIDSLIRLVNQRVKSFRSMAYHAKENLDLNRDKLEINAINNIENIIELFNKRADVLMDAEKIWKQLEIPETPASS